MVNTRERVMRWSFFLLCGALITAMGCSDDPTGVSQAGSETNLEEDDLSSAQDGANIESEEGGVTETSVTPLPDCGDGECGKEEDCIVCQEDCGICTSTCGDGTCNEDSGENCENCPADCLPCPSDCGDGQCDETEDCEACSEDCGPCASVCGDGQCSTDEACDTCPDDCEACPAECGNQTCDADESCDNCSVDCGPCTPLCGDGWCSSDTEDCDNCPVDCGACGSNCGDGICDGFESCDSCASDCGACPPSCGDGTCEEGENCEACPMDCGECPCAIPPATGPLVDFLICQPTGCAGNTVNCALKIARESEGIEAASAIQFKLVYDASRLLLDNLYDEVCYTETLCEEVNLAKTGAKPNHTGHVFTVLPPGEVPSNPQPDIQYLWNGSLNAIVANYGGSEFSLTDAYLDAEGNLVGDAHVAWFRFTLLEDITAAEPAVVSLVKENPNDLVGAGPSLVDLPATVQNGVIITQSP